MGLIVQVLVTVTHKKCR